MELMILIRRLRIFRLRECGEFSIADNLISM